MSEFKKSIEQDPAKLELIDPKSESLNGHSSDVSLEELKLKYTQDLIDRMLIIAGALEGDEQRPTLVGLSAPQIGINKRIILVDTQTTGMGEKPKVEIFINPKIVNLSKETELGREGCYSTNRICGVVNRPINVSIEAYDRDGNTIVAEYSGFTARIFQHEIDHLDGIRFPDRIEDDSKLHWVPEEEFGDYRKHWQEWDKTCPRSVWESIKAGEDPRLPV